jgi:hypothetical protein
MVSSVSSGLRGSAASHLMHDNLPVHVTDRWHWPSFWHTSPLPAINNPPPPSTHTSMRVLAQAAGAPVAGLVPHSSGMRPDRAPRQGQV